MMCRLNKGNAMIPTAPVAAIKSGLLIVQRKRTTTLNRETFAVSQAPIAFRPSKTDAPLIVPIAAAYAPLTKPLCVRLRAVANQDRAQRARIGTTEGIFRSSKLPRRKIRRKQGASASRTFPQDYA
jgi:hypothetical protein